MAIRKTDPDTKPDPDPDRIATLAIRTLAEVYTVVVPSTCNINLPTVPPRARHGQRILSLDHRYSVRTKRFRH